MISLAWDIETDTTTNGLDPAVAEIVSLAAWAPDLAVVIDGGTEADRIQRFLDLLDATPAGIAVGWNTGPFDIGFLADRAALHGIDTGFTLVEDPDIEPKYDLLPGHAAAYRARLRGHRHADIAYAYQHYALSHPHLGRDGWSLKPVAASLGIHMVEVDRTRIHELTAAENAAYNLSDCRGTYLLAELLGEDLAEWADQVPAGT